MGEDGRIRFNDYDVLAKRESPSWNDVTRRVVDERIASIPGRTFFTGREWTLVEMIGELLLPQPERSPDQRVPITPSLDRSLGKGEGNGYRFEGMPPLRETWRAGLAGIDEESRARYGRAFAELAGHERIAILRSLQTGEALHSVWQSVPPTRFFAEMLGRIVAIYYAHPTAWSEIGFGGPASPRGYVRLGFDQRDPWEAEEQAEESHDV
jgi:hypothetical protein